MKIEHDFFLGTFVVTPEQWRAVAERTAELRERADPSHFNGARRPVENVSWDNASAWCAELTKRAALPAGMIARLPTEAEWEYAGRAGTDTDYYNGDGKAALAEVGWYDGNEDGETHPVDERGEAHPFGLFGMHGNVREWCRDVYRDDTYRRRVDGDAAVEELLCEGAEHSRQLRVFRGGSWGDSPAFCRSAVRGWGRPDVRFWNHGFRLCLAPGPVVSSQKTKPGKAEAAPGAAGAGAGRGWADGVHLPAKPVEK